MENYSRNYLAYMLRLWRDEVEMPWRVTLENPHTGETIGFASLQQLIAFLSEQTGMDISLNCKDHELNS